MFPMVFDHLMLSSLPLPTTQSMKRVTDVLSTLLVQRIGPYFRSKKGADLIQLARITQNLSITRLEDDAGSIRTLSLITRDEQGWSIHVHERIFDYLAFVIPLKPELALSDRNVEEKKMIALAEFFLRHNVEHMLYPDRKEQDVIRSDAEFAMEWYRDDPTSYRMLHQALSDDMNGIRGEHYRELLDASEQGRNKACAVSRILSAYVGALSDLPDPWIEQVFLGLDSRIKARTLGECYRKSRSASLSLVKRAGSLQKVINLFRVLIREDQDEALHVFNMFKDRWGIEALLQEIEVPSVPLGVRNSAELFELFRSSIESLPEEHPRTQSLDHSSEPSSASQHFVRSTPSERSLKDRIEEARNDPNVPDEVIALIDKNKSNAAGQSGAKYAELIETLLAIPWGKIRKIRVSPIEFEEALNRTHFGLQKPKEAACDFFANLIWRYQHFKEEDKQSWHRTGSALLFVGPPGVGKTSLAISIAKALGIPYHKISLAGMRDEADIRGYGFTYEGSKPGPIVQGLVKMGGMNGMFILDEVDKTEQFAIATLLEILDPEQNHLFHDKYTQSTVDIDLSNSHFVLTANTLDTVPPAVLDRCEVIFLDRYSVEEKIAIAQKYLIQRVRERYMIGEDEIYFDPAKEKELLRYLIRTYTYDAGVRDLERVIRTLFLRIQRKEILARRRRSVRITRDKIKAHLEEPSRPRHINEEDRTGEAMALGVNMEMGAGSLIPIQVTRLNKTGRELGFGWQGTMSIAHGAEGIERLVNETRKVALTAIYHRAGELGIDPKRVEDPVHMHLMSASTDRDTPSMGAAMALALASLFSGRKIRRDVAITGEIDTQGRLIGIGGLDVKLETAYAAGCKTLIIPRENLRGVGGIGRLPDSLKQELQILDYTQWNGPHSAFDYTRHMVQVVAVDDIVEAANIAFIIPEELYEIEGAFRLHARRAAEHLVGRSELGVHNLRMLYIDEPDDLDLEFFKAGLCNGKQGCMLLATLETKESLLARHPDLPEGIQFRDFDPDRERLSNVIREVRGTFEGVSEAPLRISVMAPLPFLLKDGIRSEQFPAGPSFLGLRLFASCCTVENVQIKDCSNVVNRAYRQFIRLDTSVLDECPFLTRESGVYTITLSFIPEKYRLDVQRSEEILHSGLTRWLTVVEGQQQEPEQSAPPSRVMAR